MADRYIVTRKDGSKVWREEGEADTPITKEPTITPPAGWDPLAYKRQALPEEKLYEFYPFAHEPAEREKREYLATDFHQRARGMNITTPREVEDGDAWTEHFLGLKTRYETDETLRNEITKMDDDLNHQMISITALGPVLTPLGAASGAVINSQAGNFITTLINALIKSAPTIGARLGGAALTAKEASVMGWLVMLGTGLATWFMYTFQSTEVPNLRQMDIFSGLKTGRIPTASGERVKQNSIALSNAKNTVETEMRNGHYVQAGLTIEAMKLLRDAIQRILINETESLKVQKLYDSTRAIMNIWSGYINTMETKINKLIRNRPELEKQKKLKITMQAQEKADKILETQIKIDLLMGMFKVAEDKIKNIADPLRKARLTLALATKSNTWRTGVLRNTIKQYNAKQKAETDAKLKAEKDARTTLRNTLRREREAKEEQYRANRAAERARLAKVREEATAVKLRARQLKETEKEEKEKVRAQMRERLLGLWLQTKRLQEEMRKV